VGFLHFGDIGVDAGRHDLADDAGTGDEGAVELDTEPGAELP
jgi:hypothetical protein